MNENEQIVNEEVNSTEEKEEVITETEPEKVEDEGITPEPQVSDIPTQMTSAGLVDESEQEMLNRIKDHTNFQERSEYVFERAVNVELDKRELIVLDQEQKNELARLKLKLNKRTMKEEARAEHYERKRKAKMIRYGYLYEPYEVTVIDPNTNQLKKETRYKNFTTNTFINKYKDFANFYANLADSTKKIIKKSIKVIFWGGIITAICFGLYGIIKWLIHSDIVRNVATAADQAVDGMLKLNAIRR